MSDHEERRDGPGEQQDVAEGDLPLREESDIHAAPVGAEPVATPEAVADPEQVAAAGAETEPGPSDKAVPPREAPSDGAYMAFCITCGAEMDRGDIYCHGCGWDSRIVPKAPPPRLVDPNPSPYNRLAALLLCVLVGFFGLHRFYVGKVGTGVIWLLTLGFLGVGQVYDLVLIATGEFRDIDNRRVLRWSDAKVGEEPTSFQSP